MAPRVFEHPVGREQLRALLKDMGGSMFQVKTSGLWCCDFGSALDLIGGSHEPARAEVDESGVLRVWTRYSAGDERFEVRPWAGEEK